MRTMLLLWKWALLFIVVGWLLLEVWLLLLVGGEIGVGWTVLWVIVSGMLGVLLLRLEGLQVVTQIHDRLRREELPAGELLDMGMVLAGACMLILPGFASDALGLLLLFHPVRWMLRGVARAVVRAWMPVTYTSTTFRHTSQGDDPDVIEIQRDE